MDCRNNPAACRCAQHHPGLSAYAPDQDRYLTALEACQPVRVQLSVLTMPDELPPIVPVCTGGYLCECPTCGEAKATARPRDIRQPWEARKAA